MNAVKPSYCLDKMKQKYRWLRGTEILLWSAAAGLVSFYALKLFITPVIIPLTIASCIACIAAVVCIRQLRLFKISKNELALYLNRHYAVLKESADLILKDDKELSPLQKLQKLKTEERLEEIYPSIKIPHHVGQAAGVFIAAVAISVGLTSFKKEPEKTKEIVGRPGKVGDAVRDLPVSIQKATIKILPPAYTKVNKKTSADFNLRIEEGSHVEWEITFNGHVITPRIILSARDSLPLVEKGNTFQANKNFTNSGFYQLAWMKADGVTQYSDYYKIDVVKDLQPDIVVEKLNQFVELQPTDNLKIDLQTTISDDYGVGSANIIATVSKGSGEAIKFREEKLEFDAPKQIRGKKIHASKLIDLLRLGLQPGDELYFYIEASDIKTPSPNIARTETYFITLLDTASIETSVDGSLGVDLMPEYFRSQRQIIIDTEKLLKEKKNISRQSFNDRSNSLAHDQKVLRLRYGEFLGEEFESNIGPSSHSEEDAADVTETLGHSHDTENEHNQVEEKNESKGHAHNREEQQENENPVEEFVHAHDSDEEATFFIKSIKTKLKAAITIMWDAELHLRLSQPDKSLPHQYKALKLLKEISQDSRIYVHRTGFDPPPLKEDRRLTADLSEIGNSTLKSRTPNNEAYPNIRKAIAALEKLVEDNSLTLSADTKNIFTNAGRELAGLALKQPGRHLKTLSLLKMITQGEVNYNERKDVLFKIRTSFWNVLPRQVLQPQVKSTTTHDLDLQFLKSLEASKQKSVYDH
jgi:hypothetical protein